MLMHSGHRSSCFTNSVANYLSTFLLPRIPHQVYEKDGKALPGKKGISLSEEQFTLFRDMVKSGVLDLEIQKLKTGTK